MRFQTYVLLFVVTVAVVVAGGLAGILRQKEMQIASTRGAVSTMPIAGFHKFAADIHWMLFIQYGGSHDVTPETASEFHRRIMRIIRLDPDFGRAYYIGVLMLGPVAPELALEIADLGLDNPRVRNNWRLPMLAGQLLMNREKNKYYKNQPMDQKKVRQAMSYFEQAMKCPGAGGIALRSYVRAKAATKNDRRPLEIKEIEAWYDYWKERRHAMDLYDFRGRSVEDGAGDVSEILLTQMRVALRRFPNDPAVQALVASIVREAFPDLRMDPVALMPYQPGDRFSPHSGVKVEVYGVCTECGTVLKGRFCHQCGKDSGQ